LPIYHIFHVYQDSDAQYASWKGFPYGFRVMAQLCAVNIKLTQFSGGVDHKFKVLKLLYLLQCEVKFALKWIHQPHVWYFVLQDVQFGVKTFCARHGAGSEEGGGPPFVESIPVEEGCPWVSLSPDLKS
jgi:hypothetical protein